MDIILRGTVLDHLEAAALAAQAELEVNTDKILGAEPQKVLIIFKEELMVAVVAAQELRGQVRPETEDRGE